MRCAHPVRCRFARLAVLVLLPLVSGPAAGAPAGDDLAWDPSALVARHGDGDRMFERIAVGRDLTVLFHQRTLGGAIVEGDYIVYQVVTATGELRARREHWRDDLPDALPEPALDAERALDLAPGMAEEATLWILAPGSDVFPIVPTPAHPCWVVRTHEEGRLRRVVLDAVTGELLGEGIAPPYDAFSLTGPIDYPCSGSWEAWAESARSWFAAMGYAPEMIIWPDLPEVQARVGSTGTALFYELAHGDSHAFESGCAGGSAQNTTAALIRDWIFEYEPMPFAFIGSCDGLCGTGVGTFAYEFRKGFAEGAAVVGYCGMSTSSCDLCWAYSLQWQNVLFTWLAQGWTLEQAYDQACANYPACATGCLRRSGDLTLTLVPLLSRGVPDPHWGVSVHGPLGDPGAGSGAAWGDCDGDGDPDLFLTGADGGSRLLKYAGDHLFEDWTVGPLLGTGDGRAAAWGDGDGDGDLDLYLARGDGPNLLFRNGGSGSFVDATAAPLGDAGAGVALAWVDFDNDGRLDLHLVNDGTPDRLFRNLGDLVFADVATGPLADAGPGAAAAWSDVDGDGDQDLYLVRRGAANRLLRNDGAAGFADITAGDLGDSGPGVAACWGDHDRDGDLDLYLVNDGTTNRLLRNDGDGQFVDATPPELADGGAGRGAGWADYDSDGWLDLYLVLHGEPNRLLRNLGGGSFADAASGPAADAGPGAGCAWGDYDGDGDLDLYLVEDGEPSRLLRNKNGDGHHWLQLDLVGRDSNTHGIGARVRAVAGGAAVVREVSAGGGYRSQDALTVTLGLGAAAVVDTLTVRWPSGTYQVLTGVAADRRFELPEAEILPFADVTAGPLGDPGAGRGAACADWDADGDEDLCLVSADGPARLLRNDGDGAFSDVTPVALAAAGAAVAAVWGDYDGDGDPDLYLSRDGAPNRLLRNEGGDLTDVTPAPLDDAGAGRGVSWCDYDGDGKLDLYVVLADGANRLFRNLGGFGEQWYFFAVDSPVADPEPGTTARWGDYDGDGDADLYLANDYEPNRLFQNNGSYGFWDVTGSGPLADTGSGAGCAWGDYDNDGDLDLYLANGGQPDRLLKNIGSGFLTVPGPELGDVGEGREVTWVDFDNDGDLDLHVARYGQRDLLLRNDGSDVFVRDYLLVPPAADNTVGAAWSDLDGDGRLDVYLVNDGQPNRLLRNEAARGRHWYQVALRGVASPAAGCGARVELVAGTLRQVREVRADAAHFAQGTGLACFGLGDAALVDTLRIRWPSGIVQVLRNLPADRRLTVTETEPSAAPEPGAPAACRLLPGRPNPANPATSIAFELPVASEVELTVLDLAGRRVRTLLAGERYPAGRHAVRWDGRDGSGRLVGSGVYLTRLRAGTRVRTAKVTLVR